MKKLRLLLPLCLAIFSFSATYAQKEDKAIKAVINRFFEGMEKGDTMLVRSACTSAPMLQTFMADKDGGMQVFTEDFEEFVGFVAAPRKDKLREEIEFGAIQSEKSLASVWTPYKFYLNGKVLHCGTNSFQLVKLPDEGWKIQYILDTRRKGCKE